MQPTLYNEHLSIGDIIFRSQLRLPLRTDFSIADTINNRPYNPFLVRNFYTFFFRYVLQFRFCFVQPLLFYFLDSLMAFSRPQKRKFTGNFQPVLTSMVDAFSNCKDFQSAMGQEQKHGYNHGDFCYTWSPTSSLQ